MELLHYVDQVFSKKGVLVQLGGRYTSEQHEYATYIAKSILNDGSTLSFLEAETGIGKSLGYLTPILIHISLCQSKGIEIGKYVISTFTRQLQKQITSGDIGFVMKILAELGLDNNILTAYRMGRQAFFSLERTRNCCMSIVNSQPHRETEMAKFYHYVEDSCSFGSGLWADYSAEYGCLPSGIKAQDICLLHKQEVDNEAYLHHLECAKEADLLITNHMSSLMYRTTGLNELKIEAIVFDEAHKLSELCYDLFNHHTSINEIKRCLAKAEDVLGKRSLKVAQEALVKVEETIKSHPQFDTVEFICESNFPGFFFELQVKVKQLSNAFNKVLHKIENTKEKAQLNIKDVEFINAMESIDATLKSWSSNEQSDFILSAVSISKVQKRISLASLNIFGSRVFGHIAKKLSQKTILTSATLSDVKATTSFSFTQRELGFTNDTIDFECSLAPSNYGNMEFVLCDENIPKPLMNDEEDEEVVSFNPRWLKNTISMINEARQSNEPMLVLTVSHFESKVLYEALKDKDDVLLHKQSTSLNEVVPDFINGNKYKVLITSAGWEGLNLRTPEGTQLIKNLVITRIPFLPPQKLHEFLVNSYVKKHGGHKFAENNLNWFNVLKKVIPTLKQGFGRGVRSPDDRITIWIADCRMPKTKQQAPSIQAPSILLNAVPKRFQGNYNQARIFGQTKKEVIFI